MDGLMVMIFSINHFLQHRSNFKSFDKPDNHEDPDEHERERIYIFIHKFHTLQLVFNNDTFVFLSVFIRAKSISLSYNTESRNSPPDVTPKRLLLLLNCC